MKVPRKLNSITLTIFSLQQLTEEEFLQSFVLLTTVALPYLPILEKELMHIGHFVLQMFLSQKE